MTTCRLHGFAESGNTYKVALMLELCGAAWEPVMADTINGQTKAPEWRAAYNVMGEIPVLELDGRTLSQSGVILDYLAETYGRFGWSTEEERREVYRWLLFDASKFSAFIAMHRSLTHLMGRDDAATALYAERIPDILARVETHMRDREWIALDRATIADISMSGYLLFDGEIAVDWSALPALAAWRERVRGLSGWAHPYDLLPRLFGAAPQPA